MAQFEKRGAKWRVRISYTDETGKRRIHSKSGFRTKPEAKEYAKQAEANLKNVLLQNQKIKLVDYLEEYINTQRVNKVSKSSVDADKYALKKIKNEFEHESLKSFTYSKFQNFINDLIENNWSKSTVDKCFSLLARALFVAYRDGLIERNPAEFVQKKYTKSNLPSEKKYIPEDKISPFLEAVRKRNTIQYYLIRLILETGMRIGEACALRFEDIDRANNTISITKSYDQKRDVLGETKTGEHRIIFISQQLSIELFKLLQIHNAYKIVNQKVYNNKYNFIFVNEIGTPIPRTTIYNTLQHVSKKVLGEDFIISAHELRHTHASLLFNSGVPLKAISMRLGHKDISTTEKIYTHVSNEYQKQALNDYEKYIKKVF
ncbi:tyrosine-type recombinase/integrase [Macrococcus sp. DPC7161]|uniref:site-specific integrase n=1 Tax=Macrococcus sp. DPC7161 TaxID=2507060 RepID=UPI0013E919FB|nr:tyrosine-type recombinase/integrase [Macrococcus sp. DPC7161]